MRLATPTISNFPVAAMIFCLSLGGHVHAQYPNLRNSKIIEITLSRGGGMSGRPTYELKISGDGSVAYTGVAGVVVRGKRARHISQASVATLMDEFARARFIDMNDSYSSGVTDEPVCTLALSADAYRKQVSHDDDQVHGPPPEALIHLEHRIDEIAGSKRWVNGSALRRLFHWK